MDNKLVLTVTRLNVPIGDLVIVGCLTVNSLKTIENLTRIVLMPTLKPFVKDILTYFNIVFLLFFILQIHYNGFITVDEKSKGSLSKISNQVRATRDPLNNFMAIYWQQYVAGE